MGGRLSPQFQTGWNDLIFFSQRFSEGEDSSEEDDDTSLLHVVKMAEKRKIEPEDEIKTEIIETYENIPDPPKKRRYEKNEIYSGPRKNMGRRTGHRRAQISNLKPALSGSISSKPVPEPVRLLPRAPPATPESMQPVVVNSKEPVIFNRPYRIQKNSPKEFQNALKTSVTVNNGLVQASPMIQTLLSPVVGSAIIQKPGPSLIQPKPTHVTPSSMKPLNFSGKIIKGVQLKSIKVTLNKKKT